VRSSGARRRADRSAGPAQRIAKDSLRFLQGVDVTDPELKFVIPTYRLRDVGKTVEAYGANFERSGQTAPIVVFDDSPSPIMRILCLARGDPQAIRVERSAMGEGGAIASREGQRSWTDRIG
jgi:hypothetical protein